MITTIDLTANQTTWLIVALEQQLEEINKRIESCIASGVSYSVWAEKFEALNSVLQQLLK